ncbi:ABC transporter C family member 10-like [Humulus lupulus]|uniref:ABC transporter C family member 10-like n=1 Tax=Humulus lupulus TaxID=3486 RepID=UPI002B411118|nr:ABC transporter C family member 10-like [Humulus lupulus]XP_062074491.1 ABC transporter C family member 10-like [Humulus lupulus]
MGITTEFCSIFECSNGSNSHCSYGFLAIIDPNSCFNHVVVISIDLLLLFIFLCTFIHRVASNKTVSFMASQKLLPISVFSAVFNGLLGVAYFGVGIWTLIEKLNTDGFISPMHRWLVAIIQGITWFLLSLTISLRMLNLSHIATARFLSISTFLIGAFLCISSLSEAIADKLSSATMVLNILCAPGSILLILSSYKRCNYSKTNRVIDAGTCEPLLQSEEVDAASEASSINNVTPFAGSGFCSTMSFWWLNPLMKKGKEKLLQNEEIPQLRQEDRAQTLFSIFTEKLSIMKSKGSSDPPPILSTIFFCQKKALLVSGIFALIKVLSLTSSPLFLAAFIKIVEGRYSFKYEGYALTAGLFLVKILESLSERHWYFRTQLIGLQVRSLLSAAIYQKQLQLSNAAKMSHSPGEIVNYVTVDAYRIGEFPLWFHQIWSTSLQLFLSLILIYYCVGLAAASALTVLILTVLGSSPLVKLQHEYQTKFMVAQNIRLKKLSEALTNMKILKLYSWETHFKNVIERLRNEELKWISEILTQKGYYIVLFWSSPLLVGVVSFWTCYLLGFQLYASNVFTFLATLRIIQEPIRQIPNIFGAFVEAKVSFSRIVKFLEAPELESRHKRQKFSSNELDHSICIRSSEISWDSASSKATLTNIDLVVKSGEKLAICGEVGSGKSTLLAAILGEVPHVNGIVHVCGKLAYVSQSAWIQSGTIKENILFGSPMDHDRYQETLEKCSLVKDLEMLPFGDLTQIGERGVNLSGGQKQRIQLARALYQDADIYLLDDPFSAVDAHTATSLFNEYVMGALSGKTVLLVTHQVDFLPAFNSILLMSGGKILKAAPYEELLVSSEEFQHLVNAHSSTTKSFARPPVEDLFPRKSKPSKGEIEKIDSEEKINASTGDQLIKQEEREMGDTGFKPYIQYLKQGKGFLFFSLANFFFLIFVVGQLAQLYLFAATLSDRSISKAEIYAIYSMIMIIMSLSLLFRSYSMAALGCGASKSIFSMLLTSFFRAPMSFYDSTPVGRILSRVSSDMNIIDLEMPLKFITSCAGAMNTYAIFGLLAFLTWPVLFVIVPIIYITILLQKYYLASAKELMRISGTTKSLLASSLAESISGAMTIRAFEEEGRLFSKYLDIIDADASSNFHNFSASQWLIQRLETLCAIVLFSFALAITLLPFKASDSGFIGMALSYGLSLNMFLVISVQFQCMLENAIISVERVEQYMHIPSEAEEVIHENQPAQNWPTLGKVEICNLKVRYRKNAPMVLHGISCIIEGRDKIGIVGRTGSGKTTLISVLFRLVEPTEGKILVDGLDICSIGLHDLRSRFGIIPQDPTLFNGSVRFNLDPLSQYTDQELWEVLEKCQLREVIEEKEQGLDSVVLEEGTNWSMGQRQLFCLGRALLKRSRILVLDEATASMDNTTDAILQTTIRREFVDCTVITVAHRIPTVMDCTKVLAISDGMLVEFDEPTKLINKEGSLFGQLVKEYSSRATNTGSYLEG